MLADPATLDDGKNFSLRMALAQYLNPNARVGLLERRRATSLLACRSPGRGEQRTTRPLRARRHGARAQGVELDLAWIDGLLSAERSNQESFAHDAK